MADPTNNGLPPGATLVSGTVPPSDQQTPPPQGILSGLISKAKDAWSAGQNKRDSESAMVNETVEALKRGDFGSAAETLLDHLTHSAKSVGQGIVGGLADDYQSAKDTLTNKHDSFDPAHPEKTQTLGTPIIPMGGSLRTSPAGAGVLAETEHAALPARANPLRA